MVQPEDRIEGRALDRGHQHAWCSCPPRRRRGARSSCGVISSAPARPPKWAGGRRAAAEARRRRRRREVRHAIAAEADVAIAGSRPPAHDRAAPRCGEEQRVRRAVGQGRHAERGRQRVRRRTAGRSSSTGSAKSAGPPASSDRLPDDPLEVVQVHPVPGQEEPAPVLALVPGRARRRGVEGPVDRGLVGPARRVGRRARLHHLDRVGVGQRDRVERVRPSSPQTSRRTNGSPVGPVPPAVPAARCRCRRTKTSMRSGPHERPPAR